MSEKLEKLAATLQEVLGAKIQRLITQCGEVTIEVAAADYLNVAETLKNDACLGFEQLIDISGVDYSAWEGSEVFAKRFASAAHLLSVSNNWRLRVRVFAENDEFPVVASVEKLWPSATWYERESFDLYGIMYAGHSDLRRILTDYGFVGHPFRKDFPITGYVEMRYDPELGRVVYQPITIEPRENTPRIVREENYGGLARG